MSAVGMVQSSIREGAGFAVPMGESRMFDDIVVNMVDVGEQTGELDRMLAKVADRYEGEVDRTVETTFKVIEPILLVVMAVDRRLHRLRAVHAAADDDADDGASGDCGGDRVPGLAHPAAGAAAERADGRRRAERRAPGSSSWFDNQREIAGVGAGLVRGARARLLAGGLRDAAADARWCGACCRRRRSATSTTT
jgi:hypothetical protein